MCVVFKHVLIVCDSKKNNTVLSFCHDQEKCLTT